MNNKSKNKIRNASNSRENRSNLGSNSKQKITITKYKSEKNLFFKTKTNSQNSNSKSKQHSKNPSKSGYENFKESRPNKISKQELPSEEYYNHAKKAKSKTKLHQQQQIEKQKKSYFQSLYMHKQDEDLLNDVHDNSFQKQNQKCSSPTNSNLKMIKKIRIIEKHAIDANGKFVQKQIKKTGRKLDSHQNTFSVFQNTKNSIAGITQLQNKKSAQNLKMKKDKLKVKTKNSELYEAELVAHNKSVMKSVMKLKKHTSSGKDPKDKKDLKDLKQENNFMKKHGQTKGALRRGVNEAVQKSQRDMIQTSSAKTIQSIETEASPQFLVRNNFISCLSQSLVSFEQIIKEIEEERQNLKILRQPITNSEYLHERIRAIDFIGKICHLMSIKREAHSLAVIYLDNYVEHLINCAMKDKQKRKLFKLNQQTINFPQLIKNMKLYSITCLLLALKMDDGLMARKLCFQLNTNLQNLLKSSQSKINQKMKESIAHLHGYTSNSTSKQSRKQSVFSLSKSKTNITSLSSTKFVDENKQSRKLIKKQETSSGNNIDIGSIMKVQTDILIKFKFKISVKSPQYWIDLLTFLWDDYINAQVSWQQILYFRESDSTANVSYLLQLLQKTYLTLDVYQFSTYTVVLAIMYLVIRMKLEEHKQCDNLKNLHQKYRTNLMKSTNIIFCDNIGINELYGDFLTQMNLSLSDIVSAVKYVGQFLSYDTLKLFSFNNKSKQVNNRYALHQHRLSLYQYNAEIYAGSK